MSATVPCRKCGACCIAPSITTAIPNMPNGKPAGVRCANLTDNNQCLLYEKPQRPAFCVGYRPTLELCGRTYAEAIRNVTALERATA